ncbi:MAG: hypothetical protein Q8J63_09240 [Candidatus Aquicultor sp.]|nr:hypothetical protein [Candidatus Aquicultor sp.]
MTSKENRATRSEFLRLTSGVFCTFFLALTLFSYHAYHVSSFEMVERVGVIAAEEIIDIQSLMEIYYPELERFAQSDSGVPLVVPGLNIELDVQAADMRDVPREQLGAFIASAIIREMYYHGFTDTINSTGLPPSSRLELDRLGMLADTFVSKEFNDNMYKLFVSAGLLGCLFGILFFVSSRGFYKLTGLGGSLILVGMSAVLLVLIRSRVEAMLGENDFAPRLMTEAILPFLVLAQRNYAIVLLLGIGLFLAGRSGMFLTRKKVRDSVDSSRLDKA